MQDWNEFPRFAYKYFTYIDTIKGKSKKTIDEYFYDLRMFLRFLKLDRGLVAAGTPFDEIAVNDISLDVVASVTLEDLYEFMNYVNRVRGNVSSSRARKVASLRSFYKYLNVTVGLLENNPAKNLELPKIAKSLPRYLDLESSKQLLAAADGENKRDYCMLTLLLNCGLRVSELISINIADIRGDTLTVMGKGAKERTIYLNQACISTIEDLLANRPPQGVKEKNALFLNKNGRRIGVRGVQLIVKKYLLAAGLDANKYSTHKLRHTAATLLYKHGHVDVRALKEILGHEHLSTTEIYTHVDSEQLRGAVAKNPLAELHADGKKKTDA